MRRCINCEFFAAITERDESGYCRVLPPKPDKRDGSARWPIVETMDWCGSFVQDKAAEQAKRDETVLTAAEAAVAAYANHGLGSALKAEIAKLAKVADEARIPF